VPDYPAWAIGILRASGGNAGERKIIVATIDTTNKFSVSAAPDGIRIMNPPHGVIGADDALLLAAWLLTLAKGEASQPFEDVLEAVQIHECSLSEEPQAATDHPKSVCA
jgi:hypothetical protein